MTTVVNKRTGDPFDVYVGRPSKWGNPFTMGVDGTREQVIEKYRIHVHRQIERGEVRIDELAALYGKRLCCWCAPLPCHADVLVELSKWAVEFLADELPAVHEDTYGNLWVGDVVLCPTCGQPDNCGDCNHLPLSANEVVNLGGTPYNMRELHR